MKLIRLEKDLLIGQGGPDEKQLKTDTTYLFSELLLRELEYVQPDAVGEVVGLDTIYREYSGEPLDGKTLFVWRHGGIGDLMFMMPPLRMLKVLFPTCKLIVGCGRKYIDVYRNIPYVDKIMRLPINAEVFEEADYHLHFEQIIENNPDAKKMNAYDLFLTKFGFNPTTIQQVDKLPDIYFTKEEEKFADRVIRNAGWKEDDIIIGIQIASSTPIRSFPASELRPLTKALIERNCKIILLGGPEQIDKAAVIAKLNKGLNKVAILDGPAMKLTLRQSFSMVRNCNLLIAPDSSMIHVAGALRVPILGLYGPFPSPLRMKYYYDAIGMNSKTACSPCFIHSGQPCTKGVPSPCFSTMGLDTIMNAIDLLLERTQKANLIDMDTYRHTEFNKVMTAHIKEYMKGKGVDLGSGFMKYDNDEFQIATIDRDPLTRPNIVSNWANMKFKDIDIDYVIASFVTKVEAELVNVGAFCRRNMKLGGKLITYIPEKVIVEAYDRTYGKLRLLENFFISDLTYNDVHTILKNLGFVAIYDKKADAKASNLDCNKDHYGNLTVWEMVEDPNATSSDKEDSGQVKTEIHSDPSGEGINIGLSGQGVSESKQPSISEP